MPTPGARYSLTTSSPTPGVSIMFTATSRNGRRTAGARAPLAIPVMTNQEQRALAPSGWFAAVPGAASHGSSRYICPTTHVGQVQEMGLPAALFGCLATAACLGVTLYGGLGTIASGGADLRPQSAK